MSVMSATFIALAYNLTFAARAGRAQARCAARRCRPRAYLAGIAGERGHQRVLQLAIVIVAGHLLFGVAWPQDWFALSCSSSPA